ncbi:unnamed protein product [Acanthoscelides obtectus]|uniref:Uncharacterized protein n=1 Tax=Acanthoscelides obtectus TaxID=200917 RepID=A0A9P0K750_ACAOB|nr:unnamed protein product [Acanthoscelides obtectus]CAK1662507.1 hypothetical protein AOBTE_LOCUS23185 [Acanthoscelides obtectus]
MNILFPLCTTYLCEKGFSTYTYLKDKFRNTSNTEPDLRLSFQTLNQILNFFVPTNRHQYPIEDFCKNRISCIHIILSLFLRLN